MKFQREQWRSICRELMPLLQMANDELEPFADSMPLDMDIEAYAHLEEIGVLHVLTARFNGHLVGHHLLLISEDLRRKGVRQAQTDTIYMHAEYRRNGFVAFSENYLRQLGVQIWAASSRHAFDTSDIWLIKGFKPLEQVFVKKLELP